jgi:molybdopterin-containing oxidoreductase family membrane subunit
MGYANAERKTGNIMNRREVQPKEETRATAERHEEPARLLGRRETFSSVTEQIGSIVLARRHPLPWWISFGLAFLLTMGLLYAIAVLLAFGVGIWGINIPVAWGFAITNFVWGSELVMLAP